MKTDELYKEMLARNLTNSLRSFSCDWLGKAQNFATLHRSRPLPAEILVHVRKRLIEEGHHDLAAKVLLTLLGEHPSKRKARRSYAGGVQP
jgi:hypothetical protein